LTVQEQPSYLLKVQLLGVNMQQEKETGVY